MSKEKIYEDISSLLDEVDSMPLDEAERRRMHSLISDIERHVESQESQESKKEDEQHIELSDTVDELVTRLEADHPSFTGILRRVMNALGSMGV